MGSTKFNNKNYLNFLSKKDHASNLKWINYFRPVPMVYRPRNGPHRPETTTSANSNPPVRTSGAVEPFSMLGQPLLLLVRVEGGKHPKIYLPRVVLLSPPDPSSSPKVSTKPHSSPTPSLPPSSKPRSVYPVGLPSPSQPLSLPPDSLLHHYSLCNLSLLVIPSLFHYCHFINDCWIIHVELAIAKLSLI